MDLLLVRISSTQRDREEIKRWPISLEAYEIHQNRMFREHGSYTAFEGLLAEHI